MWSIQEDEFVKYKGWSFMVDYQERLEEGDLLLPWLDEIYRRGGEEYQGVGIWEGADLLKLTWTNKTKFRLL